MLFSSKDVEAKRDTVRDQGCNHIPLSESRAPRLVSPSGHTTCPESSKAPL